MRHTGGYYLNRTPLISQGLHKHTSAFPEAVSQPMLDALNHLQATSWAINTWVLDVLRELWVSGHSMGVLPPDGPAPVPAKLPQSEWESLLPEERLQLKHERRRVRLANQREASQRLKVLRLIEACEAVREYPSVWWPHNMDFRGRFYPIPQRPSPQGDDLTKGLIHFAEGKRLGASGLWWLMVRLANCMGHDKLTFKERVEWTLDNHDAIISCGLDPLDGSRDWTQADEPWQFLATAREYALAHEGDPEDFISHIPVNVDGVCNGLQHLSLMGLDPVGAVATNCSNSEVRHDLYTEVAEKVRNAVWQDVRMAVPEAAHWHPRIDRKLVKRAVMTTPYGVTPRGIRDQLVQDGMLDWCKEGINDHAAYIQKKISGALTGTVSSAVDIMAYFRETASALSSAGHEFSWTTPLGFRVHQRYLKLTKARTDTLLGRFIVWSEIDDDHFSTNRQANGSAPNVIHSFDASMMAETILRCRDSGIDHLMMIHDSYGTHAADVGVLGSVLRQVAFDIYSTNQLERLHKEFQAIMGPDHKLSEPPSRGNFELSQVLEAPYFFS